MNTTIAKKYISFLDTRINRNYFTENNSTAAPFSSTYFPTKYGALLFNRNLLSGNDIPKFFILNGPSGCGKGTQGELMLAFFGIPPLNHFSMGEALRSTIKQGPAYSVLLGIPGNIEYWENADIASNPKVMAAIEATNIKLPDDQQIRSPYDWLKYAVNHGMLVPDQWTRNIVREFLARPETKNGFILDGFPRTVSAARDLLEDFTGIAITGVNVVNLDLDDEKVIARLKARARMDDTDEAIISRLDFYKNSVIPAVEHLRGALGTGSILTIDDQNISDFHQSVLETFSVIVKKAFGIPVEHKILR